MKLLSKNVFTLCFLTVFSSVFLTSCDEAQIKLTPANKLEGLSSKPPVLTNEVPTVIVTEPAPKSPLPPDPNGLCSRLPTLENCVQTQGCQALYTEEDEDNAKDVAAIKFIGCIPVGTPKSPLVTTPTTTVVKTPTTSVVTTPTTTVVKTPTTSVVTTPTTTVVKTPTTSVVTTPTTTVVKTPTTSVTTNLSIPKKCSDIGPEYKISYQRQVKVVICHKSNGKSHSLAIACPALNAHISHHDDTLGACAGERIEDACDEDEDDDEY
jgi:hypothetical protein